MKRISNEDVAKVGGATPQIHASPYGSRVKNLPITGFNARGSACIQKKIQI